MIWFRADDYGRIFAIASVFESKNESIYACGRERNNETVIAGQKNNEQTPIMDLPAFEWACGTKVWHKNGKLHRDGDLPAIESADGRKEWYKNGKLHRAGDLPAIEWVSGRKEWYKNGVRISNLNVRRNACVCSATSGVCDVCIATQIW
jgi:antitoxin component YwqK of YwqJK toxin-antitoxin module